MAWNKLTYSCGHSRDVQLYGGYKEREKKVEAAKYQLCPDCYRAQQEERMRVLGYPPLEGTEKQVAWAEKIREKMTASASPEACMWAREKTSAKWWIDRREVSLDDLYYANKELGWPEPADEEDAHRQAAYAAMFRRAFTAPATVARREEYIALAYKLADDLRSANWKKLPASPVEYFRAAAKDAGLPA